jgi:hypothetical protein
MKKIIFPLALSVVILFQGCGKDEATNSTAGNYSINGNWSGTTSLNENFAFAVADDWIRELHITVGSYSQYTSSMISYIENNSFSYSSGDLKITGNFHSSHSATGTFKYGSTQGTWSATK